MSLSKKGGRTGFFSHFEQENHPTARNVTSQKPRIVPDSKKASVFKYRLIHYDDPVSLEE
jgi:hypothetical protein